MGAFLSHFSESPTVSSQISDLSHFHSSADPEAPLLPPPPALSLSLSGVVLNPPRTCFVACFACSTVTARLANARDAADSSACSPLHQAKARGARCHNQQEEKEMKMTEVAGEPQFADCDSQPCCAAVRGS